MILILSGALLIPATARIDDWIVGGVCLAICTALGLLIAALRDTRRVKNSERWIATSAFIVFFVQGVRHVFVAIEGYEPPYLGSLVRLSDFCLLSLGVGLLYFMYEKWRSNLGHRSFGATMKHGLKQLR